MTAFSDFVGQAPERLLLLGVLAFVAGMVRGFAGFGSAMVFMPVAVATVPPVWALVMMTVMDFVGPLPTLPRALRDGTPRRLLPLLAGMVVALPVGLWLLDSLPVDAVRWTVSLVALAMLALLATGWRYTGPRGRVAGGAVGTVSGLLSGTTGLAGPPAILYYLASPMPAAMVRANLLMYLVAVDVAMVTTMGITGRLALPAVAMGVVMIAPFALGAVAGAALFDPRHETRYRLVAYLLIAAAALSGLPIGPERG